ncbi:DUF1178 family protein [Phreatobacter stygius]|uniref:DUF1178 family protein n=1 Tax=Phreatobacter stygius TaxID=1940610 RepID=A0A4D7B8Q6_9HYPH|nr:DUF1178 family protein [Phreatobacter stygius]QCI64472.1 DUF1178 family protein [Phreatobacter stygius]
MIKYALACDSAHEFESWFPSSDSFDQQLKRGLVTCPACGSAKVGKTIMAPQVARKDRAAVAAPRPDEPRKVAMVSPEEQELRAKIKELRDHLVANSDAVGDKFAEEARKIHYGETEHRSIHGSATPEEARELADEGIEFHALPVLPDERN